MYATDFYYAGQMLSDFGFMICTFGTESGTSEYSAGSDITFNTVKLNNGKMYGLAGTSYEECVAAEFTIAKDPCFYGEKLHITNDEFRDIFRWLNRKEFLPFRVLNRREPWCDPCFYDVSFNVDKIMFADVLCGIKLSLVSNKPYGYGKEIKQTFEINHNGYYTYMDISDEIGFIYPDVKIKCLEDGNLNITNSLYPDENFVVKNCRLNETITQYGKQMYIDSSRSSHKINDDFNYNFIKIGNTYDNIKNKYHSNIHCRITLSYVPIIKDAP